MSRYFLRHVKVEGFRGINNAGAPLELKFKPDAVNSVHAPNGVGKSSIFEALQYALHGHVGRLRELQDAEDGESYIVNRFHPRAQAAVELLFSADDGSPDVGILVVRGSEGKRVVTSTTGHADPEGFLGFLREDFALVDYRQFVRFIDTSALERGRSFASLVGLSRYSRLRQALEGAKDTRAINSDLKLSALSEQVAECKREVARARAKLVAAFVEVTRQSDGERLTLEDLEARTTAALKQVAVLARLLGEGTVTQLDFVAAERAVEEEEGGPARKELARLKETERALKDAAGAGAETFDELVALAERRDEALRQVGTEQVFSLLTAAKGVIDDPNWPDASLCPVCDTQASGSLVPLLNEKLGRYADATRNERELAEKVTSAAGVAMLGCLEGLASLEVAATDRVQPALLLDARQGSVGTAQLRAAKARLSVLETKRVELLGSVEAEVARQEASLPPSLVAVTRILAEAKRFCEGVRELRERSAALEKSKRNLAKAQRWRDFITQVSVAFSEAETALAGKRIAEVRNGYQAIFAKLVRGGPDVKPTLNRAERSENVELILENFFGLQGISARAVLSESYRNAVAASIFLAAATRYARAPRFMILDDVTSSFDAGHQVELMEIMRAELRHPVEKEGKGLQFIILSHDTMLEKYFDRLSGTGEWHHQKLQGMPPVGAVMTSERQADRLKAEAHKHLAAGQVDIGAPFVRQYLEFKLGEIIARLAIPVPPDYATRGDRRTLSTYLEAITKAVELYCKAGECVLEQKQIDDLTKSHAPAVVSNFISHYETGAGTPFSAYALLGVLQRVDDLADCFKRDDPSTTPPTRRYYRALNRK